MSAIRGSYTLKDIERAAQGMHGLEQIIVPILLNINYEGMGKEDAEEFRLHLQIACDALDYFVELGGLLIGSNNIH